MSSPHRLHLRARPTASSKFRELVDSLRTRTALREQIAPAHLPILSHHSLPPHSADILPVTQAAREEEEEGGGALELSEIEETISETERESTRQGEQTLVNEITDLLRPEERMAAPKNEGRSGCIRRQRFPPSKRHKEPRYSKLPRTQPLPAPEGPTVLTTAIKDVDEMQMIKYWNTAAKIDENSSMETISDIFAQLIEALGISTANPTIKKYKNCVYMGAQQSESAYEGIIYYFDCKLYYGQLLKGAKHGYGVEIDFQRGTSCAGFFEQGKKSGLFCIQKERENYEGELLHGLYHGRGKLMTEDCIYTGAFENGRKHGFGEEFYPKTGLRLKGCFKHGEFQHLDRAKVLPDPTSEAQLKNKPEKVLAKSNSYDIDFQLQKTFKKQVEGLVRNPLETPANREDSKSLFDIIANTRKVNKYDYSLEDALSRFPKIRIEGIQTKLREADPEQGQEGVHLRKELETPHRRYHSQQQKSFASSHANTDLEEPLLRHRLNTPIHRLK